MIVPIRLSRQFAELAVLHLGPELCETFMGTGEPAVYFELGGPMEEPLMGSRIGGLPILPVDAGWPAWIDDIEGTPRPLVCMAVLDLVQLSPYADVTGLPVDGTLTFLYAHDSELPPWGEPYQAPGWSVVHTPADSATQALTPAGVTSWTPRALIPQWAVSYPIIEESYFVEHRPFSALVAAWDELRFGDGAAPSGIQTGGVPLRIQGDPRDEIDLHFGVERTEVDGPSDWRLLLQLNADPRITEKLSTGGSSGGFDDWLDGQFSIYFFAKSDDLARGDLSNAWLISQR
ncbi:DUF1963 domain-containing protein [Mycolicibacterium sp. 050232]|uniref:DUF1963 domain-containing protein n=1 Tax=Mycolicibacterium sp. 050232 TaxID=3113982 RepID=UPI002E2ADECF|nr:DUF1963 domain-containing protein [Mycolicibacterium sp. 050232]MED5815779.1 DUF1963 domain-containing protein [Mycolicibacterium sp. 050232]